MSYKLMEYAIALGSNYGDRNAKLLQAISKCREFAEIKATSSIYETEPLLLEGSPVELAGQKYLNAVIVIETNIQPQELLSELKRIENELGRQDRGRWCAREIDLDIICSGQLIHNEVNLQIPHVEMHLRAFVLKPLKDVLPDWIHPKLGKSIDNMLSEVYT